MEDIYSRLKRNADFLTSLISANYPDGTNWLTHDKGAIILPEMPSEMLLDEKGLTKVVRLGSLEVDLKELKNFIYTAKMKGYAGNATKERLTDGSKKITFQEGNFFYEDIYFGSFQAPGRELVKWQNENGIGVWQMNYSGGINSKILTNGGNETIVEKSFTNLKLALSHASPDKPFRGPEDTDFTIEDKADTWIYNCHTNGNIVRFSGTEMQLLNWRGIRRYGVFHQNYNGCLIIPKEGIKIIE